jgi:hypothetical protein
MLQNVTIANKVDTLPEIVKKNKLQEKIKDKDNVTIAKRLDISQEIVQKVETERRLLNVTTVMRLDILLEIAKVRY